MMANAIALPGIVPTLPAIVPAVWLWRALSQRRTEPAR